MKKTFLILAAVVFITSHRIYPQNIGPCKIFFEAAKTCNSTNSIHYTIDSEGINEFKGRVDFHSEIFMQRADVDDIGFGKSVLRIIAKKKIGDSNESFSYSYDGNSFTFFNESKNDLKTIPNPEMANVMRVLGMDYGLVHSFEYFMDKPFQDFIHYNNKLESRIDTIINNGIESVCGTECYELKVVSENRPTYWWIGVDDYRVHKLQTGIALRSINYLSIDEPFEKKQRSLQNTNAAVERIITGEEIDAIGLIESGNLAPDFSLYNLEQERVNLKDFLGKVIILDFWGTWCNPCKKVMPFYQDLANKYKNEGLEIIGISVKSKHKDVQNFVSGMGFTYIFLLNGEETAKKYGVELYPSVYIIDKEGKIVHAERGSRQNQKAEITKIIEKLLK